VHARCLEDGGAMAVVMCDLDHFKKVNDTFGHGAGDEALIAVAAVLQGDLRETDLCARYGGEEFTLLLPGASGEQALAIAERLRQRVEALDFKVEGTPLPLTISAGIAAFPELHVKTASELLLFADGALYEAKRRGRNRCLLDQGQGRYADPYGRTELAENARPAPEPPRIFA
jgi:diguanylate cyclase